MCSKFKFCFLELSKKCFSIITEHWTELPVLNSSFPLSEWKSLSRVGLFATPWTTALQTPLVHGIHRAIILEWVAIPFSRGSSWPRDQTCISCIAGRFFTIWATREAFKCYINNYKYDVSTLQIVASVQQIQVLLFGTFWNLKKFWYF